MATEVFKEIASLLTTKVDVKEIVKANGLICELGTITSTGNLKLDNFKYEIESYFVAEWDVEIDIPKEYRIIQLASPVTEEGDDIAGVTGYSNISRMDFVKEADRQTIKARITLKGQLKEGDRVLVVPVNNGQEFVVIAKVVLNK